jgi:hypothetical protein
MELEGAMKCDDEQTFEREREKDVWLGRLLEG